MMPALVLIAAPGNLRCEGGEFRAQGAYQGPSVNGNPLIVTDLQGNAMADAEVIVFRNDSPERL
jgi:hypothetical protein